MKLGFDLNFIKQKGACGVFAYGYRVDSKQEWYVWSLKSGICMDFSANLSDAFNKAHYFFKNS